MRVMLVKREEGRRGRRKRGSRRKRQGGRGGGEGDNEEEESDEFFEGYPPQGGKVKRGEGVRNRESSRRRIRLQRRGGG